MILVRFFILAIFVFASTMSVADRWTEGGSFQVDVLTQEKANKLFKEFVSHKEIPFNYPLKVAGFVPLRCR